ncbi:MAG: hypothetical protein Q8Q08_09945 [Candidatus Omnitrophota bacterium]|nr:hypothetical protein [Candidatus Omnitrophota bacterium]
MDIYQAWAKALKSTEIIRPRVHSLLTAKETCVPYVLLSESMVNEGDTVVRSGEVVVEKPALILPPNLPQFEGFEFKKDYAGERGESLMNFLLVRGMTLPSMHYNNKTSRLEVYEGQLSRAITHYRDLLQKQENVHTGLLAGPEDCWQFSVIIYICAQVMRNADNDIRKLMKEYRNRPRE